MCHRFSSGLLVIVLALTGRGASGQGPAPEPALAKSAEDTRVEWGPCPSFMPAGCRLAVLHGDPAKPNADVFLKLSPAETIPDHWHTSAERMVLTAGELHVSYKGQATVVLERGMYAYGPARLPHRATCVGSAPCILFIAFESAVDAVPTDAPARSTDSTATGQAVAGLR
jgi:quercetin dioxygenase-like cupin family protein